MEPSHIEKIAKAYAEFKTDDDIAKKVSIREIEKNGFSLSIPLYIQTSTNGNEENQSSVQECYKQWKNSSALMRQNYNTLNELMKGGVKSEQI